MRAFEYIRRRFTDVKTIVYLGATLVLGSIATAHFTAMKKIYVSSVFELGVGNATVVRATSGFLSHVSEGECVVKIVMPFDSLPPFIDPVYACSWDAGQRRADALCYTEFGCENMAVLSAMSLSIAPLIMLGYTWLGVLVFWVRLRRGDVSGRSFLLSSLPGIFASVAGIGLTKLVPNLAVYLFDDIFDRIREVTLRRGGVASLEYDVISYRFDDTINLAFTFCEVLSGFSAAFVFLVVEVYLRIRSRKTLAV